MVTVVQCAVLIAPYASPPRGEGIVTADDYASLIDPTRPYLSRVPGPSETPSRVEPSQLAEERDAGLASANDATAPGSRYHNAPLTRRDKTGANGHPPPSYGADGARSMDIADSSVRIDRFFALVQSYGRTPGVGRGLRRDLPKCERGGISPAYPFLALVWRAPGWLRWSPITCRQWREAWTRYCRPCRSGSRRRGCSRARGLITRYERIDH